MRTVNVTLPLVFFFPQLYFGLRARNITGAQTLYGSSLEFEFYKRMYENKQNMI